MRLGLGLHLGSQRVGNGASFSVSITGLSTDSLGTYGQVGGHASIGYTINPDNATETVKWSNSSNPADAATYGTGAAPTDYTASEGSIVYLHVTDGGETITRSFSVRYAAGTAPAVADGQSWTVDDTSVNIDGSASGANLTFSYALTGVPGTISINPSTGAITGTPTAAASGTATITATDQYGRTYQDTFTWSAALRTQATAADGLGPFNWTVDDTSVSVDATTDFTTNGNTLTYTATGLPAGVTIASNGIISGTPTAASSGSIVITGRDEYGRETTSTTSHTTALRTQATGGADLDLAYPEDSAITPQNLLANWTTNGNTLTVVSVSPTLPTGLSINSSGTLSGTPTTITADATYTLTMQDEYSRQTSDTFTLQITAGVASITIDSIGPQASTGEVPVTYTINQDDGTVEFLLVRDGTAAPVAADFNGGQTGPNVFDLGPRALTVAGSGLTLTGPDGIQGNFRLYALPTGGGNGDIAASGLVAIDSTDAVLSPVSFVTGSGDGEIDWSFTPDEISGSPTGFRVSLWADGSTPSDDAIRTGTGSVATTTGTVGTVAAQSGTLTGVASTIYVPTIYYIDAFGNETFGTYADVTAGAASSAVSRTFIDTSAIIAGANASTHTFAAENLGDSADGDFMIMLVSAGGPNNVTGVTADGNVLAELAAWENGTSLVYCFAGSVSGATGDIVVTHNTTVAPLMGIAKYRLSNYVFLASAGAEGSSFNVNTLTDGAVFLAGHHFGLGDLTYTGVTEEGFEDDASTFRAEWGSALTTTDETPRTVSVSGGNYFNGLAVSFRPA